jgi:hypothetical protein
MRCRVTRRKTLWTEGGTPKEKLAGQGSVLLNTSAIKQAV